MNSYAIAAAVNRHIETGSHLWRLLLKLCASIMSSSLAVTACASQQPQPTATAAHTQTAAPTDIIPTAAPTDPIPAATRVSILQMRPYSAASIWNTPIGPAPQYDPHSPEMIATIEQGITSDPSQYTFPVYFVDDATPRWDIPCTQYKCIIVTSTGHSSTDTLTGVPIPPDAQPSAGSDAQMIIIHKVTGAEYDLWQVVRTATGWTISTGSAYSIFSDGMPKRYGSRGAGVPYYAGLIRPWEVLQGRIEHALAFGYPTPADKGKGCVFPATKTDGDGRLPYVLPEGARLQLDPALTEADFDAWGLSRTGRIIARALQAYGMFLIDDAGRPKIYAEDLANNPYATMQWEDPALNLTWKTIMSIPPTAFRVIALPEAYWNPAPGGPTHGDCYAYPEGAPLLHWKGD